MSVSAMQVGLGYIAAVSTVVSVVLVFVAMMLTRRGPRAKPRHYVLGERWDYGPVLFTAVDEPSVGEHGHSTADHHGIQVNGTNDLIGGVAHGKW